MKELFVSDLDGTLLNGQAELSEYTIHTLNSLIERGMHITVATARSAASVVKILASVKFCLPFVLMNGAVIYDPVQKRYRKRELLEQETAKAVLSAFAQQGQTGFVYTLEGEELVTFYESLERKALYDFYEERMQKYYKSFAKTERFSQLLDREILYIITIDKKERVFALRDAVQGLPGLETACYRDVYQEEELWYLECFSERATKYNAVQFLRKDGGYERITGFGDNLNDLPLFAACDVRCAVENAHPLLREKATEVIAGNLQDGVAQWLENR